jgi:hypothetical protein
LTTTLTIFIGSRLEFVVGVFVIDATLCGFAAGTAWELIRRIGEVGASANRCLVFVVYSYEGVRIVDCSLTWLTVCLSKARGGAQSEGEDGGVQNEKSCDC